MTKEQIRIEAIKNGCKPLWYDGILGWAWHCDCQDNLHCCDSQCSVISEESAKRKRRIPWHGRYTLTVGS